MKTNYIELKYTEKYYKVGNMPKFRGFIAIDIPSNKKLLEMENELKITQADLKLVETENIHITLKFIILKFLGKKPFNARFTTNHKTDLYNEVKLN